MKNLKYCKHDFHYILGFYIYHYHLSLYPVSPGEIGVLSKGLKGSEFELEHLEIVVPQARLLGSNGSNQSLRWGIEVEARHNLLKEQTLKSLVTSIN